MITQTGTGGGGAVAELRQLRARCAVLERRVDELEHDQLSGLWRREAWQERAARMLATPPVRGGVVVLVIDLDGFKAVNDTYGHAAGDRLIRHTGEQLGGWAQRCGAVAGRLGGDEFAAVVPLAAATASGALAQAHGALTALAPPAAPAAPSMRVGASIGAAHTAHHPHAGLPTLMRLADEAMYVAKRAGGGWQVAGLGHQPLPTVAGRRAGRTGTRPAVEA